MANDFDLLAAAPAAPRPGSGGAGVAGLRRSPALKVGMILGLLLVMQVPLFMVSGLIWEREARQGEVLAGFRRGWGPEQAVLGPILAVPYDWVEPPLMAGVPPVRHRAWARIPAASLNVTARLEPETRRRGLFHAVVYTAQAELSGEVTTPALDLRTPGAVADWAGARVLLGASDLRGAGGAPRLEWNGAAMALEVAEGGRYGGCNTALLTAPAGLAAAPAPGTVIPFRTVLTLRGTGAFRVAPMGRQVVMSITSPWPTPSFTGGTLPLRYATGADGFGADWEVAGEAADAGWQLRSRPLPECDAALYQADYQAGVELQEAVPTYLMVARASKYGTLFLVLAFLTLFLFEMLSGVRVHLVQYGLVGLSVALFALLLVSIAEPLGFGAAYAISTAAVLGQASLYTLAVVRRVGLAAVFAGVLGALFGFLYVVLSLDTYALLAGTVALFAILSVVMLATRRVNWAAAPA